MHQFNELSSAEIRRMNRALARCKCEFPSLERRLLQLLICKAVDFTGTNVSRKLVKKALIFLDKVSSFGHSAISKGAIPTNSLFEDQKSELSVVSLQEISMKKVQFTEMHFFFLY